MAGIKAVRELSLNRLYFCLICFSIAGHFLSLFLRREPRGIASAASLATLLAGLAVVLFTYWQEQGSSALSKLSLVVTCGFLLELLGLATGFPFGRYRYTENWWPCAHLPGYGAFPILVPFAWAMVVGSCALVTRVRSAFWLSALLAGIAAVVVDLFMEATLAGPLRYWLWLDQGPLPGKSPIANSVAWFLAGALAALFLNGRSCSAGNRTGPLLVIGGQVLLMVTLRIT